MSSLTRWRGRLRDRLALLAAARKRRDRKAIAQRLRQVAEARRVVRRHTPKLTDTVAFDGTPTYRGLALMLADARAHGWRGALVSSDRREGVAERFGKSSQAALWRGWEQRRPGFNPANPPGRSSHEQRSDGSGFPGPVGRLLEWFELGMDCTEAVELVAILRRLGYDAVRPYASSPREQHHVNLRTSPTATLRRRGLA